ncbi:pyridoxamine 5'-phosphate oxidase family protein [Tundrisphaera sp. TA3]|uniref:pyridoxamine 5'-phosphate oxidase family protein n=1 Tax=Tundrisphaera sp. TA3 TaxID=3435775 RepID=UPI003EBC4D3C
MSEQTNHDEAVKTLGKLIQNIEFAMLTTAEPDGTLRSRPMATRQDNFDGVLWFFTKADTPKVDEVQKDHHVNVSYSSPEKNQYVSVSGLATLVHDKAKAKELWTPAYRAWFPDGLDDPNLALLRVDVTKAEYWDTPSSAVVHVVGFVKAMATGTPYKPGEHARVEL